ncbi:MULTISPECIES: immunity 52 family protein [unclassified Symbiopectobacterium]|uniref:immunity 52 family protein n=1 Tax=unclassified Symbiopectobacterium TaxID=2794573 RepID=UPI0022271507|nr:MULTISPECIES: immunity 52 family protein [unclassified Symbiopectobacterium]MCW2474217.1 immunity 52 family protein [Candidatus Symbiopectobacterium sp. NZEC151]MCW2485453.1 immunity 52 family protein [Candidatus Symbiopectobacterium sp. NZEC127]
MLKVEIEIYLREIGFKKVENEIDRASAVANGVTTVLKRFLSIANALTELRSGCNWFLPGSSKKDAMQKKVISNAHITDEANSLMSNKFMNDYPLVVEKIWNEPGDSILCRNYMQSNVNYFSYGIVCKIDNKDLAIDFVSKCLSGLISELSPRIISVETNNYSINEKKVFPDRLPVGWMFYIDKVINGELAGLNGEMHNITKEGKSIGTLFLSKRGFFDGNNENDIKQANDLEVLLVSHNILPTYKDIF